MYCHGCPFKAFLSVVVLSWVSSSVIVVLSLLPFLDVLSWLFFQRHLWFSVICVLSWFCLDSTVICLLATTQTTAFSLWNNFSSLSPLAFEKLWDFFLFSLFFAQFSSFFREKYMHSHGLCLGYFLKLTKCPTLGPRDHNSSRIAKKITGVRL
jgi:hypothetical protein